MNRLLLGFILLAVSGTALAADSALYKVELIVFENLDPTALQAEDWPDNPGKPSLDNAMELDMLSAAAASVAATAAAPAKAPSPPATTPTGTASPAQTAAPPPAPATPSWRRLNKSELSLNGAEQKLRTSGRYRPLLHIGWVQPLDSSDQGTPLHIYDGMELARGSAAPTSQEGTAPQTGVKPLHLLDGTFTLRRERFLHVDADLGYNKSYVPKDNTQATDAAQPLTQYVRMVQSRRTRGDELHYLDHPLFGVLFVVSPFQDNSSGNP